MNNIMKPQIIWVNNVYGYNGFVKLNKELKLEIFVKVYTI
jgi:hypothetical protein